MSSNDLPPGYQEFDPNYVPLTPLKMPPQRQRNHLRNKNGRDLLLQEQMRSIVEESMEMVAQRATQVEQRATGAEQRATEAEQRATQAEQRATQVEQRVAGGMGYFMSGCCASRMSCFVVGGLLFTVVFVVGVMVLLRSGVGGTSNPQ